MATALQVQLFIKKIAPAVQAKCKEHGWGIPSAIIAQAGIESAWGTSGLSKTCFNYWGMKWKEGCGTDYKEYKTYEQRTDGTRYAITAKFRKYSSVEAGIEGYFKFIESYSRYNPVRDAKNYSDYATQIKACGWATALAYATNIKNTVEKYQLTKYDTSTDSAYYPKYTGSSSSIVTVLKAIGESDTSFAHRKQIALKNGFSTYSGTASENLKLVKMAKSGELKK